MKELTGNEVRVSASYSKKVQIRQFEPIDASCSLTETCQPKDIEKTYDRLFELCKKFVEGKINQEYTQPAEEPTPQKKFTFSAKEHDDKVEDDILGMVNDEIIELVPDPPSDTLQIDLDEDNLP